MESKKINIMETNSTKQKPESYLIWAILSTLLCCLPLGIVSVLKANQVDNLWLNGRYDEAVAASETAKKWVIITAVVGLASQVISTIFFLVLAVFA